MREDREYDMNIDRRRLLVKIARMYYEENLTQAEISVRLRMSRQKVQRIVGDAHEQGIVQISISPIAGIYSDMERALEARFGLKEALVVETVAYDNQIAIAKELGSAAAEYLMRISRPRDKIVLSWGSALLCMVNALPSNSLAPSGISVIQGLGGLGNLNQEVHATRLVRRAASALNAEAVLLPAPAVASTRGAWDAFCKDPSIADVLDRARASDLAFVGIGSCEAETITMPDFWRAMTSGTLRDLMEHGAVGSINLRYFDANGKKVPSEFDKTVIGLTLSELKQIPHVVGVAGGAAKFKPIVAVLSAKLVNVLITDNVTAQELLKTKTEYSFNRREAGVGDVSRGLSAPRRRSAQVASAPDQPTINRKKRGRK